MSKWTRSIPIWVSRKTADGFISYFSVPIWLFMFIGFLVLLNLLVWGGIGVWKAVEVIL